MNRRAIHLVKHANWATTALLVVGVSQFGAFASAQVDTATVDIQTASASLGNHALQLICSGDTNNLL